jgi:hypothetical protein
MKSGPTPGPETLEHGYQRARWYLLLLIGFVALIYLRSLPGGFVWDDTTFFIENDILRSLKPWDITSIFLYPASYWGENLPLSEFLFVLEYNLFGDFTPAYHAVSVALYILIGLVVWKLLSGLYPDLEVRGKRSPIASRDNTMPLLVVLLLFLIHPVHVEVVAYITAQQHLLYSLFAFLAIERFCVIFRYGRTAIYKGLLPGILFYYLSVLAKYQGISTALFIPALWLLLFRRKGESLLKPLGLWIAVNIPVLLWMLWSIKGYSGVEQVDLALWESILRAVRILGAHTVLVFKPYPLSFGYPFEHAWSLDLYFAAGVAVLAALLCMIIWRRRSPATIGLLVFVVYLFPMLQIVMGISNATIYDRYLFVSLLGICMAVERALARGFVREGRVGWAYLLPVAFLALALGALTYSYIPKFRSNVASLEHSYAAFPGWKRVAFDYATELIEAGELDRAMALAETESTFSSPAWVKDYLKGRIHLERGDLARAISHLQRASIIIQRYGYFPFDAVPLARAYIATGDLDRAELTLARVVYSPIPNPIEQYRARALLEQITSKRRAPSLTPGGT